MTTAAIIRLPAPVNTTARLIEVWLSGRTASTLRAYRKDLEEFVGWAGDKDAVARLLESQAAGNTIAMEWRASMLDRKLSPATVNRRLAALRSLVSVARLTGMVSWGLDVQSVEARAYRETKGPGVAAISRMMATAGPRDRAMLRLMFDLGLRRGEIAALDVEHVNLQASELRVMGKGRRQAEWLSLPQNTWTALSEWIGVLGKGTGPLFPGRGESGRFTGAGIYEIVRRLGADVGEVVRPHGIRHTAITEALDRTDGNIRAVAQFSRHRDIRTVTRYDDNRRDLGGKVAAMVAGRIE